MATIATSSQTIAVPSSHQNGEIIIPTADHLGGYTTWVLAAMAFGAACNQAIQPVVAGFCSAVDFAFNKYQKFEGRPIYTFYDRLSEIKDRINCNCVTVYKISNGGSKPKPGKPIFVERIAKVNSYNASMATGDKVILDDSHVTLLQAMEARGAVCFARTELEVRTSHLGFIAHNENLSGLFALPLKSSRKERFFAVFKFVRTYEMRTVEELAKAEEELRENFLKHQDYLELERKKLIRLMD